MWNKGNNGFMHSRLSDEGVNGEITNTSTIRFKVYFYF